MICKFKQWPDQRANTATRCPDIWYFVPDPEKNPGCVALSDRIHLGGPGWNGSFPDPGETKTRVGNTTRRINRRKNPPRLP